MSEPTTPIMLRAYLFNTPAFEGARWAYAAYVLNPKIAADRGITEADMIGFASVPYKSEPRPTHA